jgi:hypothetical protein
MGEDIDQRSTIVEDIRNYRMMMSKFIIKHRLDESSAFVFWKDYGRNFPLLGHLARKLLCMMATSVPSESAFSLSAFLGRKERARLSEENLALSVFLKDKVAV